MRLDTLALIVVVIFAALWLIVATTGILVTMPYGIILLIPTAIGLGLLVMVIRQRLNNKEDDYYDKNVDE